ncbi:gliding motility-associated C-terminal domain-containing protein [Hymenobacter sp. BT186]|uniref:Gliding motility-associated C-terminal domain-containing protein n=1 Tax=Hymenobacter telluris TaxID=2816474 RepID=A0A939JFG0_9BACT|nr:gliding motility-associated C-terminal domain-containing protein [Hymenobacter telluris]MBO0360372.1 gliding motility-associated C-terminal domain-containing protein [Hymenobacter telluris]MBW3376399.1 gliding motility-associated C-terminal domain-containing protein [Hymenobacter norwichensis]
MYFSTRWLRPVLGMLCVLGSVESQAASGPRFVENKSQWAAPVQFRAEVPGGSVFLTATGLVYDWRRAADLQLAHDAAEKATQTHQPAADVAVHGHAVFVDFVGASATAKSVGQQPLPAYHNYFIGSDPSRWASHVALFEEVRYASLYPGTDLRVYGTEKGSLKYDFIVQPGGRPAAIALRYRGTDGLKLQADGSLLVHTSVTDVVEQRPYAYQLVSGQRRQVPCRYRLSNNTLHYDFPQGYDHQQPLVIDPAVVACTYSGSTGGVWGAATGYDNAGNIYTAGFGQSSGYPTTPGAYQVSYQGSTDVAISKLNPTGSQLLYATYLGGTNSDEVRALRTNSAGELYVLTNTFSVDFPRTTGCYDASSNGGTDLAVTHLNATGTALLGSTYVGGTAADLPVELAVTNAGAVVVGTTSSPNFPTTAGAYDRTIGGTDLFVLSLNASMTTLQWSTFLGGASGTETSTAVELEQNGNVLVTGTTNAADFPVTPGAFRTVYASPGDAFVSRLRADGGALLASTFFGSVNGTDAITHVDADAAGNIVVCGSALGTLNATPGALTSPNGRIFVASLNNALTTQRFLAKPLNGATLTVQSFKVDDCGNVHIGSLSSDFGLPIVNPLPNSTTGAFYTTTLDADCTTRLFGSYFGPTGQHVHTNSHRIDEQGRLYQSYCTNGVFPTTSTAYARTSRAGGLDVLVFKIDQNSGAGTSVQAAVAPVDSACAPSRVAFINSTVGSTRFRWNFADGSAQDTAIAPVHVFQNPGTYRVRLVALGTGLACSRNDTTYVTVRVKAKPTVALPRNLAICPGGSLTLNAGNPGTTYRWSTGATTASIVVTQPGKYSVTVDNGRCFTRDSTTVRLVASPTITPDTTGCIAGGVVLKTTAEPGSTYLWSTQATTPSIVATTSGRYTVRITQGSCVEEKAVNVTLLRPVSPPNIITPNADGKNDTFRPSDATAMEPGTRLRLYNRWGRQVYSTDDYRNDWGPGQPAGVYYYTLENQRFCTPYVKGWVEVVK